MNCAEEEQANAVGRLIHNRNSFDSTRLKGDAHAENARQGHCKEIGLTSNLLALG